MPGKTDTGDTAWMLASTALVLLMTIPGLALFYAGMVRKKNILATMMQSFAICCVASLTWMGIGYSLAFTNGNAWCGSASRLLLRGLEARWNEPFTLGAGGGAPMPTTLPESAFLAYQMTFAIIAPALIAGAFADRMRFRAMVAFAASWSALAYAPVAHWIWSPDGWLARGAFGLPGAADFAGGAVVHINAGVAGLAAAKVLGRRLGYGHDNMSPHNLAMAAAGACLLWVGWLGFDAGSALSAGGRAGMAMLSTHLAACAGALAWLGMEWACGRKPSVLGAISGAVAGLVAVTPACGFILPRAAVLVGAVAGPACFWSATVLKRRLGYDDSLDAFGVHGVGGIVGALLTGVLAYGPLSATPASPGGAVIAGAPQLASQALAVAAVLAYGGAVSFALLKGIDAAMGLRVTPDQEREGLDVSLHGERLG